MEIRVLTWSDLKRGEQEILIRRSESDILERIPGVTKIIEDVRRSGDIAVRDYTRQFDRVDLANIPLRVHDDEITRAESRLPAPVRDALDYAIENVRRMHAHQLPGTLEMVQIRPGILAGERARPIPSVGLYIPRGRGSFPSMLYMLAVPAQVAGVGRVCVSTPPGEGGEVDAACLYAARRCGVHEVYRVGGPQAIAAFAYGTAEMPAVDKIVCPGSAYISAAKRVVAVDIDVGPPAGPTESMIIADKHADPWKVALDLTIEAEHGADSSAILVTPSLPVAEAVAAIVPDLVRELPEPRRGFVEAVFGNYGAIIVSRDVREAVDIVNSFGPEHLQIQTEDPWEIVPLVEHAGEILLGSHSPFSAANYATGANAVLPTGGRARTYSPVSVRDFIKYSSIVQVTKEGFGELEPHVVALADYEGFPAHAAAFRRRQREQH